MTDATGKQGCGFFGGEFIWWIIIIIIIFSCFCDRDRFGKF